MIKTVAFSLMALFSFHLIYPFLIITTFLAIHKIRPLSLLGVFLLHRCSVLLSFLERSKMQVLGEYVINNKNLARSPNRLKK